MSCFYAWARLVIVDTVIPKINLNTSIAIPTASNKALPSDAVLPKSVKVNNDMEQY